MVRPVFLTQQLDFTMYLQKLLAAKTLAVSWCCRQAGRATTAAPPAPRLWLLRAVASENGGFGRHKTFALLLQPGQLGSLGCLRCRCGATGPAASAASGTAATFAARRPPPAVENVLHNVHFLFLAGSCLRLLFLIIAIAARCFTCAVVGGCLILTVAPIGALALAAAICCSQRLLILAVVVVKHAHEALAYRWE